MSGRPSLISGILLGCALSAPAEIVIQPRAGLRITTSAAPARIESTYNRTKARVAALPEPQETIAPADLPKLGISRNSLFALPGTIWPDSPKPTEVRLKLGGSSADFLLRQHCISPRASTITLERFDPDAYHSDRLWSASFASRENYLLLKGHGGIRSDVYYINLIQQPGRVTMSVYPMVNGAQGRKLPTASATDLADLRKRYPVEVHRYLAPLVQTIAGRDLLRPGAADVYRAFPEIQPAEEARERLAQVCHQLDSEDPAERERGSAQLRLLGAEGVLAALRLETAHLSPELQSRITHFLAEHMHIEASRAALLSDGPFLVDCLEDQEPLVRRAAHKALAALLGMPIEYDPEAPGPRRAEAADKLRELIQPPRQAQPVVPSNVLELRR